MWPFRRRREETLNEQLLREAGLDGSQTAEPAPPPPPEVVDPYAGTYPAQQPLGVWTRAMGRPATSDVVTTAQAPGLLGPVVTKVPCRESTVTLNVPSPLSCTVYERS